MIEEQARLAPNDLGDVSGHLGCCDGDLLADAPQREAFQGVLVVRANHESAAHLEDVGVLAIEVGRRQRPPVGCRI